MVNVKYNPITVWFNAIVAVSLILALLILALYAKQPAGLVFSIVLFTLSGYFIYNLLKSFLRFLFGLSAIELNGKYFIDHQSGIKILWNNIIEIGTFSFNNYTYITFVLKNESEIFNDINPVAKVLYKLESRMTGVSYKTNISFVKGKNNDIFWRVRNYHSSIKSNT
jgi:hypothetical protein